MTTLSKLVAIADDLDWCGTKYPGWHPPKPTPDPSRLSEKFGPSPEPWRSGPQPEPWAAQTAVFWQSIRLFQLGQRLQSLDTKATHIGDVGAVVGRAAEALFGGWCGTVPLSVLIWWLIHHPSPPPPPWEQVVIGAAGHIEIGARMGSDLGAGLQKAGAAIIKDALAGGPG